VKDKGLELRTYLKRSSSRLISILESFRGDASIKSWIYRITVNTSKDYLQKKSLKQLILDRSFLENFNKSESAEASFLKFDQNEQFLQVFKTRHTT
jgi:RNA polymerase sigma-70 factor, ECF subfamily